MIQAILKKVFGSRNDRLLKQYARQVRAINALEPQMERLSDAELAAKSGAFRVRVQERLARIPDNAEGDPERPASFRTNATGRARTHSRSCCPKRLPSCAKPPDARSTCGTSTCNSSGIALHYGKIAEMRTGEGKTLAATLPAY